MSTSGSPLRVWKAGAWIVLVTGALLLISVGITLVMSLVFGIFPENRVASRMLIGFLVGLMAFAIGSELVNEHPSSTLPGAAGVLAACGLGIAIDYYHKGHFALDGDFGPPVISLLAGSILLIAGAATYNRERSPSENDPFRRFLRKLLP